LSFTNQLENERQKTRLLGRILIGLFLVILVQSVIYAQRQNELSIHYPPDLRSGAVMQAGDVPPSEVYLFAQYILQQLYNWDKNGQEDFPNNVGRLRYYLTPGFQQQLKDNIRNLPYGELRERVRVFKPIAGSSFSEEDVQLLGDSWLVWLDVNIHETVLGQPVKDLYLRYPIQVVRYDTNREMNPWQLALNGNYGYDAQPIPMNN
jgi:integrating conjugative element protein (TIGR03746 family)